MKWTLSMLLGLSFVGILLGCDSFSPEQERVSSPSPTRGAQLYTAHCARCHGEQGEGRRWGNATALNNQDFLATASDEFLWETIIYGRPGTEMLAWGEEAGGLFGEQGIADLIAFLRSWQNEPSRGLRQGKIRGSPERGATLYALNCANCHGPNGMGDLGMGPALNNQAFLKLASDGFLWEAIARGRQDTPMFPSLKGLHGVRQLSSQEIDDLVAFIRSWEKP
jgi:cytochrome c oxidase cbb3-type subunit 3